MDICVDFDGTIVEHEFPQIGKPVPGALGYLRKFIDQGARIILFTMRSDGQEYGDVLTAAVEYLQGEGIELFGVNTNPEQSSWTSSPKAYGQIYIDDAALGCPLVNPIIADTVLLSRGAYVDWDVVGPAVMQMLDQ